MGKRPHGGFHPPQAVDEQASKAGLRAVAVFEACKGLAVVALAIALVAVRDHIEDLTEELIYHLHVDFDHRWARALMHGASKLSDMRIWTVLAVALTYSSVRFIEAWGLWHRRVWAEWFALLSGALYLPYEILQVAEHRNWESIAVLAINLAIVLYMMKIRIHELRSQSERTANGGSN